MSYMNNVNNDMKGSGDASNY